jgi:hypothetical protein
VPLHHILRHDRGCRFWVLIETAHVVGSGKSYLMDIASAIATGQPCHVIAAGRTDLTSIKKLKKRLKLKKPALDES